MSGICAEVINDLRSEIQATDYKSEHVSVAGFSRVMSLYFKYWFEQVINNMSVMDWHNKFGSLFVVKALCIRYNPIKIYFVTENGVKVRKEAPLEMRNGKRAFMFWDCGKKWRMYKFSPATKWNRIIFDNFQRKNMDYPEMSLDNYGRKGSPSYIQIIR